MHVVIPAAGRGTRLTPLSDALPKALAPIADTTLLDHAIDSLAGADVARITIVAGHLGEQLVAWSRQREDPRIRIVWQAHQRGQADAVLAAAEGLFGPTLLLFVDTIHDVDLATLDTACGDADGLLHVCTVEDPRAFGVAVVDEDGWLAGLVEKPPTPVSNEAIVGVYFVRDGEALVAACREVVAAGPSGASHGEYYLLDALARMLASGRRFRVRQVGRWLDCGNVEALLEAGGTMLREIDSEVCADAIGSAVVLRPPVRVAAGASVDRCILGPHVAIGAGAVVRDAVIGPEVGIGSGAKLERVQIARSVIGREAHVSDAVLNGSAIGPRVAWQPRAGPVVLGTPIET